MVPGAAACLVSPGSLWPTQIVCHCSSLFVHFEVVNAPSVGAPPVHWRVWEVNRALAPVVDAVVGAFRPHLSLNSVREEIKGCVNSRVLCPAGSWCYLTERQLFDLLVSKLMYFTICHRGRATSHLLVRVQGFVS